jgi:hypothetical protein
MTPLRRRTIEDMQVRNLAPLTQITYCSKSLGSPDIFGQSPERLGKRISEPIGCTWHRISGQAPCHQFDSGPSGCPAVSLHRHPEA